MLNTPDPFDPGYRLTDGNQLNYEIANPSWSVSDPVTATAGGTMATSQKVTFTITNVTTASVPGAGITLPQALPGRIFLIVNNSLNDIRIFAEGDSTIDGASGAIGVLLAQQTTAVISAVAVKQWQYLNIVGAPPSLASTSTIASLRTITPTASAFILVEGYYATGDGGGGEFYGVTGAAPGTYVENGGTVILPAGGNGSSAWLRIINGSIEAKWFGAPGAGISKPLSTYYATLAAAQAVYPFATALTQETDWAGIQAAIDYTALLHSTSGYPKNSDVVVIADGRFVTKDTIVLKRQVSVNFDKSASIQALAAMDAILKTPTYTSASNVTIATGSQIFTVNVTETLSTIDVGDTVYIAYSADQTKYMSGTVTAFSGTSLTVNVTSILGSGTYASWVISDIADRANNISIYGGGTFDCNGASYADSAIYLYAYAIIQLADIYVVNGYYWGVRLGNVAYNSYNLTWDGGFIRLPENGTAPSGTVTAPGSAAIRADGQSDSYINNVNSIGGEYGFWGTFYGTTFTNCHPYGMYRCAFHSNGDGTRYISCDADLGLVLNDGLEAQQYYFVPPYTGSKYVLVGCQSQYAGIVASNNRDVAIRAGAGATVEAVGCIFNGSSTSALASTFAGAGSLTLSASTQTYITTPFPSTSEILRVESISSLRAVSPTSTTAVANVTGYYAEGDGGGGEFYGVTGAAAGTYVENGGTVILPTGGNGSSAWLRNFDAATPISIKWFGAVGDGATHPLSAYYASLAAAQAVYPFVNSLTQETSWAAIQAAIIYAQSMAFTSSIPAPSYVNSLRPTLFIPSGKYRTTSPLFFTGTPNNRGVGIKGDVRSVYDSGSVIAYYGADYNIRVQNGFISASSLTVGTGSKTFTVNYNSSTNYAAAGDTIVLTNMSDASATMTGTITSYSGTTMVVNIASSTGSGTYTGWAVRQGGSIYQIMWDSFGINVYQSCNGALLLDDVQESVFNKVIVQGFEAISTPPSFTVLYGIKSAGSGIALSRFQDCAINQVNTGYDFKLGGIQQTTIDGAGVYAANICYNLGLVYNLNIMNTFNESFEYGVLLENTATSVGQISCFGVNILNNSWSIAEGDVNARALKVNDTTTTKSMVAKFNYYGNLHQSATSPPEYILLNSNPSNGFTDVEANIYDNVFYGSSASAISSKDSRARVTQYGNSSQSAYGYGNYLPIISRTSGQTYALSGSYTLAQDPGGGLYGPTNTSENVILSVPVPPNLLGLAGIIKITATWSVTNNANVKVCRIRFNGIAGTIMCQVDLSAGQLGATFNTQIVNNGVTNAQNAVSWIFTRQTTPAVESNNAYSTVDTTALTTLDFTVQKAVSTDTVLLYAWLIEVYPT